VCGLCGLCDLRNFQVHLAFNACKEILILWPTAKGARKATASSQKGEKKFHKGLCAPRWIFMPTSWNLNEDISLSNENGSQLSGIALAA